MALALLVAVFVPLAGLVLAALNGVRAAATTESLGPRAFREWRL